jgi:hypothetical protein
VTNHQSHTNSQERKEHTHTEYSDNSSAKFTQTRWLHPAKLTRLNKSICVNSQSCKLTRLDRIPDRQLPIPLPLFSNDIQGI